MLLVVTTLGFLCLAAGIQGQTAKNVSVCSGRPGCNSPLSLQCGADQHIFITRMLYGTKSTDSACSKAPSCSTCCQPDVSDCFGDYSMGHFQSAYEACWNRQTCTYQSKSGRPLCALLEISTFSVAEYICLQAGLVTEFHTNTSITAPAVAVHYDPIHTSSYPVVRGNTQTWHCQVDTADCVQRHADLILVQESYASDNSSRCSRLGWSGGPLLLCIKAFQYPRFTATTPFDVSVTVDSSYRFPHGWAVVRAVDGGNLTVMRGYTSDSPPSKPNCATSPLTSTTKLMMPGSTAETSTPSQPSARATSQKNPSSNRQSSTSSQPSTSSRDLTVVKVTTPMSMPSSSATGTVRPEEQGSRGVPLGVAVTGWVLAAVLGALFFISVIFLIRLRRRGSSSASSATHNGTQGGVVYTEVIHMEQTSHRSQSPELMGASSSRPADYVNAASSHTDPASVYVNEASGQRSSSHAEPRSDSQQEYSSLDWSRDQVNPYTGLRRA